LDIPDARAQRAGRRCCRREKPLSKLRAQLRRVLTAEKSCHSLSDQSDTKAFSLTPTGMTGSGCLGCRALQVWRIAVNEHIAFDDTAMQKFAAR
jgi:hypothetical protein